MTLLGDSPVDVYPLCLGTNTFGWTSSIDESHQVLDEYTGAGGNFLDTADSYSSWAQGNQGGESESIIGQWLTSSSQREELIIATKVGKLDAARGLSRSNIRQAVEGSLRRLGTDYIDLYYAHAEDSSVPVEESAAAFAELVDEGKIRYVGLSNHSPHRIQQWMDAAPENSRPIVIQPHYNLLHRQEVEGPLLECVQELNLGIVPYFSLAAGLLTGKYRHGPIGGARESMVARYQGPHSRAVVDTVIAVADAHNVEPAAVALAWLLTRPAVVAPIASARIASQLPALFEGVSIVLSESEIQALDEVSQNV